MDIVLADSETTHVGTNRDLGQKMAGILAAKSPADQPL